MKAALAAMGILRTDALRRPLLPLGSDDRLALASVLRAVGVLDSGGRFGGRDVISVVGDSSVTDGAAALAR